MNTLHLLKFSLAGCVALGVFGCGGGGGGDEDNDFINVSGLWTGALTMFSDTCNSRMPVAVNSSHNVAQDGQTVTLVSENVAFNGGLANTGFIADATITGNNCQDAREVEYSGITSDEDGSAGIVLRIVRTCGATVCQINYTGTAARASAGPTATPNPTVPTGGGCPAIIPNPDAGVYGGDGGCGITTAAFRFEQQGADGVVVLEPFGLNGATSFVVNPANNATAASRRADLAIGVDTGYLCTMQCSAPATFTVTCTKEGGISCTEKF